MDNSSTKTVKSSLAIVSVICLVYFAKIFRSYQSSKTFTFIW